MTKMHYECLKYPKTLENDKNAPITFKMTKIPLKPQK